MSIIVLLVLVAVACTDSQPRPERPAPLKLSAEGFGPVAIGDSLESVSAILSDRWGPPLTDREFHCESPAGADIAAASTTEGLRLGARVGEAGEIYGPRFMLRETTLGPEWWIERPEGTPLLRGSPPG